ncbi:MAG: ATP-binding protein [Acidimicrobiia bacterium]|nr:ATP-binding protein [Acidimicrobiia bacterium]
MTTQSITVNQAMATFRGSLLRRASAVGWFVTVILGAQAVREQVFQEPNLYIPVAAIAATLIISTVIRWEGLMATRAAPWIAATWLAVFIGGIAAVALVPGMKATAEPILFGLVAVSGLLLTWWAHAIITVSAGVLLAYITLEVIDTSSIADVVGPMLTVVAVGAATALVGMEFERQTLKSAEREAEIDHQRLDFEHLYEVSATLARAESLSEIVPHLVGTICKYLDAQVGVVLLYNPNRHRLEVMSPIWVNGYPLETDPMVMDVAGPGVVAQAFRAAKPIFVKNVDTDTDGHVLLKELGLQQAMVAPLKVEAMRVGAIIIGDPYDGEFNETQLDQLGSLAAPAGLVLSQIGRYEAQADMTKRLEEVAQMKSDFVSTVSHELRTPLTSIIGSLDTVSRPELAPEKETAQDLLATARRQAGRLQRLIDDLLVVSRIDRGSIPVHLEPILLTNLFAEIGRTVSIDPVFSVDPDNLAVEADRDHLSRIMINLVENAAKYAAGSPVEIYGWEKGPMAVIAVVDHGPGIPSYDRERVFERFTQIDQSDTRSKGGTGLGLSIVKSLAEVMRGSVRVEDTEGGGATFVVELPRSEEMALAEAQT